MVRIVEAMYMPLQSCVVVSCKFPTLSNETCNFMHCNLVKKQMPYHMVVLDP
jgi:hypothetical protein